MGDKFAAGDKAVLEVHNATGRLHDTISSLEVFLSDLQARLSPVLTPIGTAVGADLASAQNTVPDNVRSDVANTIHSAVEKIQGLENVIKHINQRLEV